jgi:hypothetical protein
MLVSQLASVANIQSIYLSIYQDHSKMASAFSRLPLELLLYRYLWTVWGGLAIS